MQTDIHSVIKVAKEIAPGAAITSNAATNGSGVAVAGFESLEFLILSGTITDGGFTPKIQGSDDSFTTPVDITSGLLGTVAGATFAAADDNAAKKLGVDLQAQSHVYAKYRLVLTQAGATSGGIICAMSLLGSPRFAPTT